MNQIEKVFEDVLSWINKKNPNDESYEDFINEFNLIPQENKLESLLAFLGDRLPSYEEIIKLVEEEQNCWDYSINVTGLTHNFIYSSKKLVEVVKHGEVMTPISLVNEMLNKLPDDTWSNPHVKILDPANGIGTFISVIVGKLMKGLDYFIEDECERYKYIIENMIYVCEIQPNNMLGYYYIYNKDSKYNLNTYYGSFLDNGFNEHMKNAWKIDGFDIIVGNPPYNKPDTNNSGNNIWPKFIDKIILLLLDKGHMCVVHPSLWRRPQHKTWNLLTQFQILHLDIHDTQDGLKVFEAGTRYDWYVLNKIPIHTTTTIRFEDGEIIDVNLSGRNFLPNKNISSIDLITNSDDLCKIIHSRSDYAVDKSWVGKEENNEYQYPLINSIHSNGTVIYRYSTINTNGHFGVPKIIISDSTSQILNDFNGEYGLTSHCLGICIENDNEGVLIEKALNTKKFQEITDSIKWSNFWVDPRFFKYLNKDFYKQFVDKNGNEIL